MPCKGLEAIVVDIVGRRITAKEIDRLRKSVDKAEHLYYEGREREKVNENLDFHITLARISGNTLLIDTLSAILELISYVLVKVQPSRRITLNTFKAHREIIDLLEAGKVEEAKALNKAHIKDVNARLIKKSAKKKYIQEAKQEELQLLRRGESR